MLKISNCLGNHNLLVKGILIAKSNFKPNYFIGTRNFDRITEECASSTAREIYTS